MRHTLCGRLGGGWGGTFLYECQVANDIRYCFLAIFLGTRSSGILKPGGRFLFSPMTIRTLGIASFIPALEVQPCGVCPGDSVYVSDVSDVSEIVFNLDGT